MLAVLMKNKMKLLSSLFNAKLQCLSTVIAFIICIRVCGNNLMQQHEPSVLLIRMAQYGVIFRSLLFGHKGGGEVWLKPTYLGLKE